MASVYELALKQMCGRRHSKINFVIFQRNLLALFCESSARHMKCQVLFSLKNKTKYFTVVVLHSTKVERQERSEVKIGEVIQRIMKKFATSLFPVCLANVSNFSSFTQYFQYISNFRSQITYLFVVVLFIISSILQISYVDLLISRNISESPLDFEIRESTVMVLTPAIYWEKCNKFALHILL